MAVFYQTASAFGLQDDVAEPRSEGDDVACCFQMMGQEMGIERRDLCMAVTDDLAEPEEGIAILVMIVVRYASPRWAV